jgi:hypothetical protein
VLSEVSEMGEDKEYFVWEPYKKSKDVRYTNKDGVQVTNFDMNITKEELDKIIFWGRGVSGLVEILVKDNVEGAGHSSQLYNIRFKGHIKKIRDLSEEDQIRQEKRRISSRDSLRRSRGKENKKIIEAYFPKEEFSNRLNEIFKENDSGIEIRKVKDLIYAIISEKHPLTQKESNIIYYSKVMAREIKEFMLTRGYEKDFDVYTKVQK